MTIVRNPFEFVCFTWVGRDEEKKREKSKFRGRLQHENYLSVSCRSVVGEFSQLFRQRGRRQPPPPSIFTPHFDFPVSSFPLMASSRKFVNVDLLLEEGAQSGTAYSRDVSPPRKDRFRWRSHESKSWLFRGLFLRLRNAKTIDNSVERPHCERRERKKNGRAGPPSLSLSLYIPPPSFQMGERKKLL